MEELITRMGSPVIWDLIMGSFLVLILLEAVRRKVGATLSIIVIIFSLYAFFASKMPDFLAFKSVSLGKYISQIALSDEGIFGIPLGVSVSTVFLFVFLGALLNQAGAGEFFTKLALSLLGKFRGGSAKAAVLASTILGSFSGSSIANVVTSGNFTIPLMKKTGYPATKAAAIEVAASTDGQIMPPIMGAAAFIIAEYINAPYIEVAKAALIPALISSITLLYITHLEACKLDIKPLNKKDIPSFKRTLKDGALYLIVLFVLFYELLILRHTPEFSAYITILLFMGLLVFQEIVKTMQKKKEKNKTLNILKNVWNIFKNACVQGCKNMVPVALATAASGIIVGIVTMGLGGMISEIVAYLANGNVYILLGITALACLLLGIGLPTTATYIVMASLTAPIIVELGAVYQVFIPLVAAHLFCFYFGILADDTPPVGLAAYAAAAIAKSNPIQTGLQAFSYDIRTAIIPFFFIFNTDLLLYDVNSFLFGLLIFIMAILGMIMFSSAIQGWFFIKNKWYEIPLFLFASFLFMHPRGIGNFFHIPESQGYYLYFLAIFIVLFLIVLQKKRGK